MAIILDGHRVNGIYEGSNDPRPAARSPGQLTIDDIVSASEVTAMEIYPHVGNAPAALQPLTGNGSCGLVAIWTGGR